MKSEERHELETNSLAKLLEQTSDKLAPYASFIIYGLLAFAAIWAVVRLSTSRMQDQQLAEWNSYVGATLPGRLDEEKVRLTADSYTGKPAGDLAEMAWADAQMAQGCQQFFTNKKLANELLDKAQGAYEKLVESAHSEGLRQRAQLALARTLEAKCDIAKAIAEYEKVTGPYAELSKSRVEMLKDLDVEKYATWLASAEGARNMPAGGISRPSFSPDALSLPGMQNGPDYDALFEKANAAAPDAPAAGTEGDLELPAADDATESAPADETPAEETPADTSASE